MVRIALCDDNITELLNMSRLIDEYKIERNLSCECKIFKNGFALVASLESGNRFDIYCLDIIMPAFNGIDVAKEIRNFDQSADILFFTSHSEFALDSYLVSASNYVIKPISKEKIFSNLDKVIDKMKINKDNSIIIQSNDCIQRIVITNVMYIEFINKIVHYYFITGKIVKIAQSFYEVCDTFLSHKQFIKPHHLFIVNMDYIDAINVSDIVMSNNIKIPIPKGQFNEVKDNYLAYEMNV